MKPILILLAVCAIAFIAGCGRNDAVTEQNNRIRQLEEGEKDIAKKQSMLEGRLEAIEQKESLALQKQSSEVATTPITGLFYYDHTVTGHRPEPYTQRVFWDFRSDGTALETPFENDTNRYVYKRKGRTIIIDGGGELFTVEPNGDLILVDTSDMMGGRIPLNIRLMKQP